MARGVGGHGPANVMKHMKGIEFPANKKDIVQHAKQGEGPDTQDVVDFLERIDDREYAAPNEILKQYKEHNDENEEGSSDSQEQGSQNSKDSGK